MNSWKDFQIGESYFRNRIDKDGTHFICVGKTIQEKPLMQNRHGLTVHEVSAFAGAGKPSDWAVWRTPREFWLVLGACGSHIARRDSRAEAEREYEGYEIIHVREVIE